MSLNTAIIKRKRFNFVLVFFCYLLSFPLSVSAELITFESISTHTFVRDQFQNLGVRFTGDDSAGSFSGKVLSEGDFGIQNYGNSATQVLHVGVRERPTTISFVNPDSPQTILGATTFSILMGDGDSDLETFRVTYFDTSGLLLGTASEFTTGSNGLLVSANSLSLGGLIGSVELRLLNSSASGVVADDLQFTLAAVPLPPTFLLLGSVLFVLRVKKHPPGSRA